jgi:SRSO17 transposase
LAQAAGHERPFRLQHLLSGAAWDEDAVRDRVRGFVARHLGDGGVLIFDETGDLKKGTRTAGAGRQYTGTAGRIENAIVAVYATYATPLRHALIDRELYVQKQWFTEPERMAKAGFEPDHAFATKPQLAKAQAERALDAGLTPAWATGDEVYGRSSKLREVFEARGIGYVFAIGCDFQLTTSGHQKMRADNALHLVEPRGWNRRSAGAGSKGPRYYDWAWIATASPRHQLLIRRSISTGDFAYYLAFVPDGYVCSLTDLVKIADTSWAVEDDFQDAKQSVGLDETQVRGYRAWKRHTALALAAYALLAVASALAKAAHPRPVLPDDSDQQAPADCGLTALTVPEIQRLLATTTAGRTPGEPGQRIPSGLVKLATTPPGPSPLAPLPHTPRNHSMTTRISPRSLAAVRHGVSVRRAKPVSASTPRMLNADRTADCWLEAGQRKISMCSAAQSANVVPGRPVSSSTVETARWGLSTRSAMRPRYQAAWSPMTFDNCSTAWSHPAVRPPRSKILEPPPVRGPQRQRSRRPELSPAPRGAIPSAGEI